MALTKYSATEIALDRKEKVFVVAEASFGTLTEPANANLIPHFGSPSFAQGYEKREDKQKSDTRSKRKPITGRLPHGTFSVATYIKPSGTAGTVPVPAALIEGAFCAAVRNRAADTVAASPAPAADAFAVGTLANYAAGEPLLVEVGADDHLELCYIVSIDTALHVEPSLSAAPTAGKAVKAANVYELGEVEKSYTIWHSLGHSVRCIVGAVVEGISGPMFDGNADLEATFSGGYQREINCGTSKLTADATDVATELTVEDGDLFDIGARLNLTDGTNTETKVIVTGKTSQHVLQVTRGTGNQAWTAADGIDAYPWIPAGTDSGYKVQTRIGACQIDSVPTDILSLEIGIANNPNWHEDEKTAAGADYVGSYALVKPRDVSAKLDLYLRQKHLKMFAQARDATAVEIRVPAFVASNLYPVAGKCIVAILPQVEFKTPAIAEKDGERSLSVETMPYGVDTYDNELALWFL